MTAWKALGTYGNGVGVVTPLDHKLSNGALVCKTTTPLVVRPGVFYSGNPSLVTGTAGMAYSVAAFAGCTQRSAGAGVVDGGNDGALSVATTAAPGSNSRWDVTYWWNREYSLDGVDSNPVIGVVQGTAAASPTVPSLAAFPGAIELSRILVPAGVVATNSGTTITQTAPFTSVDGGKVPFRTTTEMNLWLTALTGQPSTDLSTNTEYRWSGAAWIPSESTVARVVPTGQVNGSIDAASGRVTVAGSASSVSVLGAFSSAFRRHRITWDLTCGGAAGLSFLLRAAGSDIITNYDWLRHHAANVTDATSNAIATTSMILGVNGITGRHWGSMEINSAALAEATLFDITANATANPMTAATSERLEVTGQHRPSTAYTDFTIAASTGNLTAGWVRVEGIL